MTNGGAPFELVNDGGRECLLMNSKPDCTGAYRTEDGNRFDQRGKTMTFPSAAIRLIAANSQLPAPRAESPFLTARDGRCDFIPWPYRRTRCAPQRPDCIIKAALHQTNCEIKIL